MSIKSDVAGHRKKKKWIQTVTQAPGFKEGALTAQAHAAGESPMEFAREHYHDSGTTGARARFAVNAQKRRQ
jgi:hypothetical protein